MPDANSNTLPFAGTNRSTASTCRSTTHFTASQAFYPQQHLATTTPHRFCDLSKLHNPYTSHPHCTITGFVTLPHMYHIPQHNTSALRFADSRMPAFLTALGAQEVTGISPYPARVCLLPGLFCASLQTCMQRHWFGSQSAEWSTPLHGSSAVTVPINRPSSTYGGCTVRSMPSCNESFQPFTIPLVYVAHATSTACSRQPKHHLSITTKPLYTDTPGWRQLLSPP